MHKIGQKITTTKNSSHIAHTKKHYTFTPTWSPQINNFTSLTPNFSFQTVMIPDEFSLYIYMKQLHHTLNICLFRTI